MGEVAIGPLLRGEMVIGLAIGGVLGALAGGAVLAVFGDLALALAVGLAGLLGGGYLLAGLAGGTDFWSVLVGIGLVGGAGIGLGYVVPIAVGMRWFPEHKGMITGLAVAGFGFGAMGWVKLAGTWGNLIETTGLAGTFMIYGIAFAVLVLLGSIWMVMPPKEWLPDGYSPPVHKAGAGGEEFSQLEILRTPQFYMIFLTFAVSAGAGLMSIGLMKLYPMEALQAGGYTALEASAIAGTAMAVFFSIANGIGRIVWGTLSDRLGRKNSVIIMAGSQGIILLLFTSMAGNEYLLYLGAALIGFNFGGNFSLFPTLTADIFGNDRVGQNYPYIFLSYGVGGIIFPMLGGTLGDMGLADRHRGRARAVHLGDVSGRGRHRRGRRHHHAERRRDVRRQLTVHRRVDRHG